MVDVFSKSERSQIMRSVHSVGTGAEKKCEKLLSWLDVRFRRHPEDLPGRPDFVMPQCNLALFVHGCFWHSHRGCKNSALPTSNLDYWAQKIGNNCKRDRRVRAQLRRAGWRTAVIWECKLGKPDLVSRRLLKLVGASSRRKKLG